jgi:hypothetical protein
MSDWDLRLLCPDGACTGVIGSDGTCRICGKVSPHWGDERRRGTREDAEAEPVPATAVAEPPVTAPEVDAEWSQRVLCDDGACTGVIAADGRCNLCRKARSAS